MEHTWNDILDLEIKYKDNHEVLDLIKDLKDKQETIKEQVETLEALEEALSRLDTRPLEDSLYDLLDILELTEEDSETIIQYAKELLRSEILTNHVFNEWR